MALQLLCFFLVLTFAALGGIHIYWLLDGRWGLSVAIPTKGAEASTAYPPPAATLAVALALLGCGAYYLNVALDTPVLLPDWVHWAGWVIPAAFALRAVGEFNYVGLFKRVKDTPFAQADTRVFVPICLAVAVAGFGVALLV